MSSTVHFEELKELVGGTSIDDVCIRLQQRGIKYVVGKRGKPFTTVHAINAAMGLNDNIHNQTRTPSVRIL